ncbi:MAG: universal stress protein [Methanosarcinaceae archaeon]|nr:universal stress protein [Methanosarcinaceae archaeon]
MTKILLPTDGSEYSSNAAKVAGTIACKHNSEILVLHVVTDTGVGRKTWQNEGAESIISSILTILKGLGCEEERIESIVEDGNASDKIVEVAKQHNVDRIIMGTRGKSGFKKIVGSVTEKVLQKSDVLVLVVPPNYKA